MRKIRLFFLFFVFLSIFLTEGFAQGNAVRLTKFEGQEITGIDAGHMFQIEVTQGGDTKAVVEINEELEQYLIFTLDDNGTLHLGLKRNKWFENWKNSRKKVHLKAYVTVSRLDRVELSSMAILQGTGHFTGDNVRIIGSGAAKLSNLNISSTGELRLTLSEVAHAASLRLSSDENIIVSLSSGSKANQTDLNAKQRAKLTLSGGSNLKTASVTAPEVTIEQTSAASSTLNITAAQLFSDLSSTARATLYGTADNAYLTCSSASSLYAKDFLLNSGKVVTSSAAKAVVNITDNADFSASSASTIRYMGTPVSFKAKSSSASSISSL